MRLWWHGSRTDALIDFLRQSKLNDIESWLTQHLRGHNSRFTFYGGRPHYSVVEVYRKAEDGVRVNLEFATVNIIKKVAVDLDAWTPDNLGELFLLTDPILLYSKRQAEVIDATLAVLRAASSSRGGVSAGCSAAQSLLTLDYKAYPIFWMEMFEIYGEVFSPFVIEGLGRSDLKALGEWLLSRLPHSRLERDLINILPFFIEREGVSAVAALLAPLHGLLSPQGRSEIEADAEAGGFRLMRNHHFSETQLGESLADIVVQILQRKPTSILDLWDNREVRKSFRQSLQELAHFLELQERRNLGSRHRSAMAKHYAQLLAYGLATPQLASITYQQVAEHAPLAELYEVTSFALSSQNLAIEEVFRVLRETYSAEDAERIVYGAQREAHRRQGWFSPTQLPEETVRSLEAYPILGETEKELAQALLEHDTNVPKNSSDWVSEMAGAK